MLASENPERSVVVERLTGHALRVELEACTDKLGGIVDTLDGEIANEDLLVTLARLFHLTFRSTRGAGSKLGDDIRVLFGSVKRSLVMVDLRS